MVIKKCMRYFSPYTSTFADKKCFEFQLYQGLPAYEICTLTSVLET
ncbi:hypothetical protein SAMN05421737_11186 [Shouchella lonarensis]|uniref:Uncharacterized protein n=1 Tax=Shouchella lonarensis TaxID=1464122 RepID=A0A1G6N2M3_9BACI|nr:hypothetical protein SAMN05421737_11186 [Shouchella lonarensis]